MASETKVNNSENFNCMGKSLCITSLFKFKFKCNMSDCVNVTCGLKIHHQYIKCFSTTVLNQ